MKKMKWLMCLALLLMLAACGADEVENTTGTLNGTEMSSEVAGESETTSATENNQTTEVTEIAVENLPEYERGPILAGNNQVNWDNVKPTKVLHSKSYVNNLTDHPRILVNDWDEIVEKIGDSADLFIGINATDFENLAGDKELLPAYWYGRLKAAADKYVEAGAPEFTSAAQNGTDIELCREARAQLQTLAFVYNVEKLRGNEAEQYLEAAYDQMLEMSEWLDWDELTHYLSTAEIVFGYACAYDWLYYDLMEEQRAEIYSIIEEKAIKALVLNYEGGIQKPIVNITKTTNNWNPVCNGSAIGVALAIADEYPLVSEYIIEHALEYICHSLPPYSPEGAYPEGVSYWDYGTLYLTFAMDMLDNSFVEGFKVPEKYHYYKTEGISTTCDFPIYFTGTIRRFNYGDCSSGLTSSAIFYWMANKFDKPEYAWYQNDVQMNYSGYRLAEQDAISAICWYDSENVEETEFALEKFFGKAANEKADAHYNAEAKLGAVFNGMAMRSSWERSALYAAMQGGNNGNNHMHLSLGTYVIDWLGARFVTQIGDHNYGLPGKKNQIYYRRAEAYNTLVINPSSDYDQPSMGYANLTKYGASEGTAFGVMDMSNAYTTGGVEITSAQRGMMMTDNRSRVIIQDEVKLEKASSFWWYANIPEGSATISADGKSAILKTDDLYGKPHSMVVRIIEGPANAVFTLTEAKSSFAGVNNVISGYQKTGAGKKPIERLTIHVDGVSDLNLSVEYVGLQDGYTTIPAASTYVPLADWSAE